MKANQKRRYHLQGRGGRGDVKERKYKHNYMDLQTLVFAAVII